MARALDPTALLRWEKDLEPGARVRVRWGYGLGFRADGLAEVVRFNRKSIRVRLLERVPSPHNPEEDGWQAGLEFSVPNGFSEGWNQCHRIEPMHAEELLE